MVLVYMLRAFCSGSEGCMSRRVSLSLFGMVLGRLKAVFGG